MVNICAKVNFWKLDVCTISELRMKKRVPKSECTQKIEWTGLFWKFWLFGQGQRSTWSKYFLSLLFRWFGSGSDFQVGQIGLADVIHDVIQLRHVSGYSAWKRVARGKEAPACERVITDRGACFIQAVFVGASRGAWQQWCSGYSLLRDPQYNKGLTNALVIQLTPCCQSVLAYCWGTNFWALISLAHSQKDTHTSP